MLQVGYSHGVVCWRAHPRLLALWPTRYRTVHLVRVVGWKSDHG